MSQPIHKLFDLLTVELVERIKSGEASSQDLNVARQLLKDCRISAAPEHEPLQILADEVKARKINTSFEDYYDDPQSPVPLSSWANPDLPLKNTPTLIFTTQKTAENALMSITSTDAFVEHAKPSVRIM